MSNIIPKNQASGAFQPWDPVHFDKPQTTLATVKTKIKGDNTPVDARIEIAPGVSLPTADDFERMQQEAYKEGYAAGYEEGSARGRMEAAELHQLLQGMDQALGQFDQEVAEELQALALEVARQVVRETLDAKPESILTVIREALLLVPQQSATVRVHPQDLDLIRQYLGEYFDGIEHRLVGDDSIAAGGAIIESAGGQIDAQITTRWRRVVEHLSRSAAHYGEE